MAEISQSDGGEIQQPESTTPRFDSLNSTDQQDLTGLYRKSEEQTRPGDPSTDEEMGSAINNDLEKAPEARRKLEEFLRTNEKGDPARTAQEFAAAVNSIDPAKAEIFRKTYGMFLAHSEQGLERNPRQDTSTESSPRP